MSILSISRWPNFPTKWSINWATDGRGLGIQHWSSDSNLQLLNLWESPTWIQEDLRRMNPHQRRSWSDVMCHALTAPRRGYWKTWRKPVSHRVSFQQKMYWKFGRFFCIRSFFFWGVPRLLVKAQSGIKPMTNWPLVNWLWLWDTCTQLS